MGSVKVYNIKNEDFSNYKNNFYIGRGSIFGNPYTHEGTTSKLAKYIVQTREEAIEKYKSYFEDKYLNDKNFQKAFDDIYELYKNGEDIYLQCFCKPLPCHGDYISERLQSRYLKEMKKSKK